MNCPKCNWTGPVPNLEESGPHTKALCPACGAYIKFLGAGELAVVQQKMMPPSMEKDRDTGFVAIAAIRYAMGRRTYAPSLVTSWVKRHWEKLQDKDRGILKRDVAEEIARFMKGIGDLGDPCDQKTWIDFFGWMEKKEEDET